MIDFKKELETILETDPLGLLEPKAKSSQVLSQDERLAASFKEINAFMQENGREPTASRDISERKLYSRLKGLRESPEKAAELVKYDNFNLLDVVKASEKKEPYSIGDVLQEDELGLLGDATPDEVDPTEIFKLTNIPKVVDSPDYVAKRKPCKEFDQFESLFKQNHLDLASRKIVTKPFTSEQQIAPGEFFIMQGMMVFVANRGRWEKKNFGNVNARLYCVFENGTESTMLLRSLAAALWKDKNSRQIVDANQHEMYNSSNRPSAEDKPTGYIYVLRSLSADPQIKEIKDLYKIGYSSHPVAQRIHNAKHEPTYLMAEAKVVTEFQTYNLNPQKLELLIHKFFAEACLNLDVFDSEEKRYTPREWFVVPLHVIEQAINYLMSGDITRFKYDVGKQEIVAK